MKQLSYNLEQAFALYISDVLVDRNLSYKTVSGYQSTANSLYNFFGDIKIETLTFENVRDYKAWLFKKNSPATVRVYTVRLRRVLGYMRLKGYDVLDPSLVGLPKTSQRIPEVLTPKEVDVMIKCSKKPRNKLIISLLYSTGLRVSELVKLDRVDVMEDEFTVRDGKGGYNRLCFIDARTRKLINAYMNTRKDDHPALLYSAGDRMKVYSVDRLFKNMRCDDRKITPHTMRHSFATNLNRNGIDIYSLMKMMGHKKIETTTLYLHLYNGQLKEDFVKYHSV